MSKNKKKGSKESMGSYNFLDMAAQSLRKYRRVTKQIGKMSTAQKVVGGVALLAAGLTYLSKQPADDATHGAGACPATPAEEDDAATEPVALKQHARKRKKAGEV